jgi:hypothetical protein
MVPGKDVFLTKLQQGLWYIEREMENSQPQPSSTCFRSQIVSDSVVWGASVADELPNHELQVPNSRLE